MKYSTRR